METEAVCNVCPHRCRLKEGIRGLCRARICRDGVSVSENYGRITAIALDPIEKKPLKNYYPGSKILSVGSYGCNFRCPFCQNYEIAWAGPDESVYREISPKELVRRADGLKSYGNIGIAFTYNEPTIGYEYVLDTEKLAKEKGLKTVLVTNGCASPEIWDLLLPYTDALNIDLKGFSDSFYRMVSGSLETVKRNIIEADRKCHVELTTLIIPGENDSFEDMREEAKWIASVDPEITLHVTRFFPRHLMTDKAATRVSLVYALADEARKYLKNVYTGNC